MNNATNSPRMNEQTKEDAAKPTMLDVIQIACSLGDGDINRFADKIIADLREPHAEAR